MKLPWILLCPLALVTLAILTTGCRAPRKIRTSDYVGAVNQVSYSSAAHSPVVAAVPPQAPDLGGPRPVEVYISYALSQNSDIEVARKLVDVAAYRVPQVEEFLTQAPLTDEILGQASEKAREISAPIEDVRATALYQKKMVNNLVFKGLSEIRGLLNGKK